MLKKTIKYTDYNGVDREEDFYFNLSKAEIMEMEIGTTGGYVEMLQRIVQTQDGPSLMKIFKELIMKAYGRKSADGKRFEKSKELSEEFVQTEAYSNLFMELITGGADAVSQFVIGIMPGELQEQAKKEATKQAIANGLSIVE